jgi:hypothetical protein
MAKGFDTQRLICDRKVLAEIVAGCSEPAIMTEIFRLVREMAFRRISVAEFNRYCESQPCIFWQPVDIDARQISVRSRDHGAKKVLVKVARVLWTIVHVCSEQGPELLGTEEVLHTCGHNGHSSSSRGACLNPAHMIRGTVAERLKLRQVRKAVRSMNLKQVQVA